MADIESSVHGSPISNVPKLLTTEKAEEEDEAAGGTEFCVDKSLESLLYPSSIELPIRPLPAINCNFSHHFALNVMEKDRHDQYIYRHANGLCVIGLAPTHKALDPAPSVIAIDFNVGKQSRVEMKARGKRKRNAHTLEANSILCKVMTCDSFFMIRCCVRGILLEVNERLVSCPSLLNKQASREGYVAIIMPKAEDWAKAEKSFATREQYLAERGLSLYT